MVLLSLLALSFDPRSFALGLSVGGFSAIVILLTIDWLLFRGCPGSTPEAQSLKDENSHLKALLDDANQKLKSLGDQSNCELIQKIQGLESQLEKSRRNNRSYSRFLGHIIKTQVHRRRDNRILTQALRKINHALEEASTTPGVSCGEDSGEAVA